jgi:hypothetical protein
MLVSFSDFARLKGVSPAAVTIASKERIKDAIVLRDGKKLLDRSKALELWDRNTSRNGSERLSKRAKERDRRPFDGQVVDQPTKQELRTLIMGLPEDQIPGLDVSRERREHYNAEIARLDALEKRKELVSNDEVVREASRLARQVRDLLLMIPGRNAAKLATMSDTEAVRALLSQEIEAALRGLANA